MQTELLSNEQKIVQGIERRLEGIRWTIKDYHKQLKHCAEQMAWRATIAMGECESMMAGDAFSSMWIDGAKADAKQASDLHQELVKLYEQQKQLQSLLKLCNG